MQSHSTEFSRILFDATLTHEQIVATLESEFRKAYEEGYNQAAHDITMKLQDLIPRHARTVPDARVQGAWRDAANIALNHLR